ncbi:MAG: hypothetical protein A7315_12395 [Candidatus Altiarchaeales archaeon WOR_SM1_79]|nr:MAG: hypothetical protein A7315_12395 [Candidatus Altiarchaeales archaeon WOR_SM1_79]
MGIIEEFKHAEPRKRNLFLVFLITLWAVIILISKLELYFVGIPILAVFALLGMISIRCWKGLIAFLVMGVASLLISFIAPEILVPYKNNQLLAYIGIFQLVMLIIIIFALGAIIHIYTSSPSKTDKSNTCTIKNK